MNQRERILLVIVCCIVIAPLVWGGINSVGAMLESRRESVRKAEERAEEQQFQLQAGTRASEMLVEYEMRSLPQNKEAARAMYQHWLLQTIEDVGWDSVQVTAVIGRPKDDVFFRHPFNVSGRGNLVQITEFLHAFYSVNYLHRIERMTIKPVGDTRELDITMTVEAISMPGSPNTDSLPEGKSDRLQEPSLEHYIDQIAGRNLFGPPNNPPRLSGLERNSAIVNQRAEIGIRASDPDRDDRLSYEMEAPEGLEAQVDQRRGRIMFTATELGDYEFTVTVHDNGTPAKSDRQTYKVSVVNPPPPRDPGPPPPPSFNAAKFAFVTGVVEVNGKPQVWIHVRTTGELLKLETGQSINIGQIEGRIERILPKAVHIITKDEKHLLVGHGQALTEGSELPLEGI